jgi:stage II sporulation protein D
MAQTARGGRRVLLLSLAFALAILDGCSPRPPARHAPDDEWVTMTGTTRKKEARGREKPRERGEEALAIETEAEGPDGARPVPPLRVAIRIDAPSSEACLPSGGSVRWPGGEIVVPEGAVLRFSGAAGTVEIRGAGDSRAVSSPVQLLPDRAEPFTLEGKPYPGTLAIVSTGIGLTAVNAVGLEDYLRGVVPWEIGWLPERRIEALKAQAVAARTYALGRVAAVADTLLWDLVATESDQVYRGLERTDPVVDRAIEETAGVVATYEGDLVRTYYSSTCGGRTAPVPDVWPDREPAPYLRSVGDGPGGDAGARAFCSGSPHFRWRERWKGDAIESILRNLAQEKKIERSKLGRLRDVRVEEKGASGRVLATMFVTEGGDIRVGGDRVRWILQRPGGSGILRSSWFALEVKRSGRFVRELTAEGRGHGHGVGMCQWGAMGMADEGFRYDEILPHYYPGSRLEAVAPRSLRKTR